MSSPDQPVGVDLTTVADDEAVTHSGTEVAVYDGLAPATVYSYDGTTFRTFPDLGERLATVATVNDLHFGELEAGKIDGVDLGPVRSVPPGAEPYPEVMNRGACAEIETLSPDVVVVKGDITADALPSEKATFDALYGRAFGDRLVVTRGNHDTYAGRDFPSPSHQEVSVPGATVAVLDTARVGRTNGYLDESQLEWLDELGSRSKVPVMVFGHHPVWSPEHDRRSDDFFGIVPQSSEGLASIFSRRPSLAGYFAGHTHRNRVINLEGCGNRPFAEVGCVKDFPGSWAEYRVYEGGILQVHRRISTPEALEWSESCRPMYGGTYYQYSFGTLSDRCFAFAANQVT